MQFQHGIKSVDTSSRLPDTTDPVTMLGLAVALAQSISNPITAVAAEAASFASCTDTTTASEIATKLVATANKVARDIRQFSNISGPSNPVETLELNQVVRDAVALIRDAYEHQAPGLRLVLDEDLPRVDANRLHILRVLREVLSNAIEAQQEAGDPVDVQVSTWSAGEEVLVEVRNQGSPIANSERPFDLFYTTKSGRHGTGLSISRALTVVNGGRMWMRAKDSEINVVVALAHAL